MTMCPVPENDVHKLQKRETVCFEEAGTAAGIICRNGGIAKMWIMISFLFIGERPCMAGKGKNILPCQLLPGG